MQLYLYILTIILLLLIFILQILFISPYSYLFYKFIYKTTNKNRKCAEGLFKT